jgi:hypothetical protein
MRRLLFRWRGTSKLVSDQLRRLKSDARKRLKLISHSPKLVKGRDAFLMQRPPSVERQTEPGKRSLLSITGIRASHLSSPLALAVSPAEYEVRSYCQ